MKMRRTLGTLAMLAGLAALVATPRDAHAELHLGGLASTRTLTLEASERSFGLARSPELRARRLYEVLVSLPTTESADRTYDVRPIIHVVFGHSFQVSENVTIKFVRGRNLIQANLGTGKTLGVVPNGFGVVQGGVLSFSTDF